MTTYIHTDASPLEQLDAFLDTTGASELFLELQEIHAPTAEHCRRTGQAVLFAALSLGVPLGDAIKHGHDATIHDLGKEDPGILTIVDYDRCLTPIEEQIVAAHPGIGKLIAEGGLTATEEYTLKDLARTFFVIGNHHATLTTASIGDIRRLDTQQRSDLNDSIEATKLLQAADVVDAIFRDTKRRYRIPLPKEEAIELANWEITRPNKLEITAIYDRQPKDVIRLLVEQSEEHMQRGRALTSQNDASDTILN